MVKGNIFVALAFVLFAGTIASAADYYAELGEFYVTKLFSIETQISALQREKTANKKQMVNLTRLVRSKSNIEGRLANSIWCYRKVYPLPWQRLQPTRGEIDRIIEEKARKYGVNPNFIKALVECESGYEVYACSKAGAMGLTQLMPETCKDMGVKDPFSPEQNVDGGTRYLVSLLREFRDARKALYAYNCGPEVVRQGNVIPLESKRFANAVLAHFKRLNSKR